MGGVRMQFSKSLKLNHLFRRLYHKGKSCANKYLVLYCRKNGSQENRIGLTVSGKLGHAVVRNKIRRRLREIYRLHEAEFRPGWDIGGGPEPGRGRALPGFGAGLPFPGRPVGAPAGEGGIL